MQLATEKTVSVPSSIQLNIQMKFVFKPQLQRVFLQMFLTSVTCNSASQKTGWIMAGCA